MEIENTQKRRDNNGAKSLRGLEGILGSGKEINVERTEYLF